MPKGKTNQPLQFMIPEEWLTTALFRSLAAMGHTLVTMPKECINSDIIFGVNCHILTDDMMLQKGMIDEAIRAARRKKKKKINV